MDIKFHHNENLEGTIVLELLEEDYLPRVDHTINKYRTTTELKGFRKGQVPYQIVKKMYGHEVLFETVMDMAKAAVEDFIKEHKIDLWKNLLCLAESTLHESKIDLNSPGTMRFKVEFVLAPAIDFKELEQCEVERHVIKGMSEEMFHTTLSALQAHYGESTEVTQSEPGDRVYGMLTNDQGYQQSIDFPSDFKIGTDGTSFLQLQPGQKLRLQLGPDQLYILPKDEHSIKYKAKKIISFLSSLPGEYEFQVEKIVRRSPANIDQALFDRVFVARNIHTTEEFYKALQKFIIEWWQSKADEIVDKKIKELVLNKLVFNLPEKFIKKQIIRRYLHLEEEDDDDEVADKLLEELLKLEDLEDEELEEEEDLEDEELEEEEDLEDEELEEEEDLDLEELEEEEDLDLEELEEEEDLEDEELEEEEDLEEEELEEEEDLEDEELEDEEPEEEELDLLDLRDEINQVYAYLEPTIRWNCILKTFAGQNSVEVNEQELFSVMEGYILKHESIDIWNRVQEAIKKGTKDEALNEYMVKLYRLTYDMLFERAVIGNFKNVIKTKVVEITADEFNELM